MTTRDYLTIGDVVKRLGSAYPDLTISKIRFLEEEGLISPERTAGGYRKFTQVDVQRIDLILKLQREHFLPLAVIRERLADYDRGKVPVELRPAVGGTVEAAPLPFDQAETLAVADVPSVLGLPTSFIDELAGFGLIEVIDGEHGKELATADVQVTHVCWDLRRFGVEPRHLRMYETFADREAAFFGQILMPAFRHRTPETRQKLVDTLNELTTLTSDLKARLLRRSLSRTFEDLT